MSKSQRLRESDVRAMLRLMGEVCELPRDRRLRMRTCSTGCVARRARRRGRSRLPAIDRAGAAATQAAVAAPAASPGMPAARRRRQAGRGPARVERPHRQRLREGTAPPVRREQPLGTAGAVRHASRSGGLTAPAIPPGERTVRAARHYPDFHGGWRSIVSGGDACAARFAGPSAPIDRHVARGCQASPAVQQMGSLPRPRATG